MNLVRVTPSDLPEAKAFLTRHADHAMFPLSNLAEHGLDGDAPRAPRMWRNSGGPVTDVLTITNEGMVMPFLPSRPSSGVIQAAAKVVSGRTVLGVIGPAAETRALLAELGLTDAPVTLDPDEARLSLALDDLIIPEGDTHIEVPNNATRPVLTEWMIDYHVNTLGMTPDRSAKAVPPRVTREIAQNRRILLMQGERPVATTAFNAALPEIVQIGGVYTPPALRGTGLARRAVALHLAQARDAGVTRATLSASEPAAIAAYTAIGFRQIGTSMLSVFETPQVAP